jgi:putative transposase
MQHQRHTIRLRHYDYSQPGSYFVTIVAQNRLCLYGQIVQAARQMNSAAHIVESCWLEISSHFPHVSLDEFIIMPNHLHGLIIIAEKTNSVGAGFPRPTSLDNPTKIDEQTPQFKLPTLGQIVGYFKYQTTKQINISRGTPGAPVWQRNYYEHVIRNATELAAARQYIQNNPAQWAWDKENPKNS